MTTTRRDFLRSTAAISMAAGGLGAIGAAAPAMGYLRATFDKPEPQGAAKGKGMKVLILGGTGFLGPACTEALVARGHTVTLFNRGVREKARKERGRPSQVPDGVEVLYGNRDPDLYADMSLRPEQITPETPKGLKSLEGRSFDWVIDTSGYFPRHVKASAELLKSAKQYVFISTISVYLNNETPDADESDMIGKMTPGAEGVENMGPNNMHYGPLKALCEQAAEAAMPGKVTNIRPGFIVGPRDTTARFMYWPWRLSRGGEVLVPGTPDDPVQFIDVRDLADFIVLALEKNIVGVFNATGPAAEKTSMKTFIEETAKGVQNVPMFEDGKKSDKKADALKYTWADFEFLSSNGVNPGEIPIWLPPLGELAGFHSRNCKKAIAAGLKFRPIADTAKVTLEWWNTLPAELQTRMLPTTFTMAKEKSLLEALAMKRDK